LDRLSAAAEVSGRAGSLAEIRLLQNRIGDLAGAPSTSPHGRPSITTAVQPLSERELQVLRLLDSELTGPEIARELFVSHNTLRTHTKHIFAKLDVTSRRAAVRRAHEHGLL
jgi:LuxR family maltose regulon positive regulatory protein